MKSAIIIGSPKLNDSNSLAIAQRFNEQFKDPMPIYHEALFRHGEIAYERLLDYDQLLVFAPLYNDELSANLIEFLNQLEKYIHQSKHRFLTYAVFNCGFIEGIQNKSALDIMNLFAIENGCDYQGGVGIGGGWLVSHMPAETFMTNEILHPIAQALRVLADHVEKGIKLDNLYVQPKLSEQDYIDWIHRGWNMQLNQNGLNEEDAKQPYSKL